MFVLKLQIFNSLNITRHFFLSNVFLNIMKSINYMIIYIKKVHKNDILNSFSFILNFFSLIYLYINVIYVILIYFYLLEIKSANISNANTIF